MKDHGYGGSHGGLILEEDKTKRFIDRLEEFEISIGLYRIKMGVDFMLSEAV